MAACRMVRSGLLPRTSERLTCCHSRSAWMGRNEIDMTERSPKFVSVPFHLIRKATLAQELGGVAFRQQQLERADALRLAADRAVRALVRAPGENIEMRPRCRLLHETLQEQCRGDRACKAIGGDIVHVGN